MLNMENYHLFAVLMEGFFHPTLPMMSVKVYTFNNRDKIAIGYVIKVF